MFRDRIPLTKGLILSNAITFFLIALGRLQIIPDLLAYSPDTVTIRAWTLVTYPLVAGGDVIGILFSCYWLWIAGGTLERSLGTTRFGVFFFLMSAISALGLLAGTLLSGAAIGAQGLWLPLAGTTVAFAMMNPEQQILFFFIIPMKLKYLALLDVALVLLSYGRISLILGVTALAGCAYAYWYVRRGAAFGWDSVRRERPPVVRVRQRPSLLSRLNPFARLRERRERKRLEDLFRKSGME